MNSSEGGGPGEEKKKKTISVCNFNVVFGLREPPPRPVVRSLTSPEASEGSAHSGDPSHGCAGPPLQHRHWAQGVGDPGDKCERPGPRVEQNLWPEVTRKCSLPPARPPAPPTGGHPKKHPGLTTCWGRRRGEEPRTCNSSPPRLPRPRS